MAGASEIKIRINSITETKKVTDAMFMISSVKMQRAKREHDLTKPYFDALREEIGELLHFFPNIRHRCFSGSSDGGPRRRAIVLITSDKGLAGSYNQDAIKRAEREIGSGETILFPVGEYGYRYFLARGAAIAEDFSCPASFPTVRLAQRICEHLLEYYNDGRVDEIVVLFTNYHPGRTGDIRFRTLLPLVASEFYEEEAKPLPYGKEFLPDPDTVLDGIIAPYLTGFIYGALVESYCSEQTARMEAMRTAGTNAEDMLRLLHIRYNKVRQAAITSEITEITAGAKTLREGSGKGKETAAI